MYCFSAIPILWRQTYDVCQILTQSILIEMFRTFGCLEKLDGWRSANGYKDHASPEKAAIFHTRLKAHTIRHNNTTMAHKGTHKHNITALNFTMSESLWCQIYIFLFCLTNVQVICANSLELRATFNFAIISRRRSPASSRLRLGKGYRKYSSPCRRTLRPGGPAASQSCRTTIDLWGAGAHDGASTTWRLLCCLPPLWSSLAPASLYSGLHLSTVREQWQASSVGAGEQPWGGSGCQTRDGINIQTSGLEVASVLTPADMPNMPSIYRPPD